MARFAVFSIFVVAVAVSGASAGLIPDIIPDIPILPDIIPTPKSKDDAENKVIQGCNSGKAAINIRISAFIAANSRDSSLTPVCKKCIAEKSNQVRKEIIEGIDAEGKAIISVIAAASDSWLTVWVSVLNDLPSLILGVLDNCQESLDNAKSGCIAETAAA